MYEDMFSKSLKPIIKFTSKNKLFTERNKFEPHHKSTVDIYNQEVIKSKINNELKFTNFYSYGTDVSIKNRLEDLSCDLSIIKERDFDTNVNFNNNRIADIIKLSIPDFDVKDVEKGEVRKVSLTDSFGCKTGVRVYFLLDPVSSTYQIIVIDLFHLVIPSQHKDKKGNRKGKEKMLNETFNKNKNNKECISNFFNYG